MDYHLFEVELARAETWLTENEPFPTAKMQMCLITLKAATTELRLELDRQDRKTLGRNIKSALTGDRILKEKLRDLQQVNNAVDSLNLSRLSVRIENSEATLKSLEKKIDTLTQHDQQFESRDRRFRPETWGASDVALFEPGKLSRSDSHTSYSPWQEYDEDNILQKLSALAIKGLDILADVLECEDYLELSNRLRVWGLGLVNGPFAVETLKARWEGPIH
ncbi:hypothetical protein ACHAO9_009239 [Fusarium lateritium]